MEPSTIQRVLPNPLPCGVLRLVGQVTGNPATFERLHMCLAVVVTIVLHTPHPAPIA